MSSSNSPCAACKCLRRKCTQECVFAPYFPPDNPQKFTNVHKVFGASNVAKLLNDLNASHREDAVNSLAYEAEYRLRDPVYGCVGLISILQHKLKQVQQDLDTAKKELAAYVAPNMLNHPSFMTQNPSYDSGYRVMPYNMQQMIGIGLAAGVPTGSQLMIREPQQILEAQQLAALAAAREQEMLRSYEQQNDLVRFSFVGDPVTAVGFNQMPEGAVQPSLELGGSYETHAYHHQIQQNEHAQSPPHQLQLQSQQLLLQQSSGTIHQNQQQLAQEEVLHLQQPVQRAKSEEGLGIGPSC